MHLGAAICVDTLTPSQKKLYRALVRKGYEERDIVERIQALAVKERMMQAKWGIQYGAATGPSEDPRDYLPGDIYKLSPTTHQRQVEFGFGLGNYSF